MRQQIIALVVVLTASTTLANAQFKDWVNQVKKKIEQAGTAPGVPATPKAEPAMPKAAAKENAEALWPNIAVDPAIVQQQQDEVRKDCERKAATNPTIDCECIVRQYTDFRLRVLSRHIREAERARNLNCKSDPATCSTASLAFDWLTSRETQLRFPTSENRPNGSGPLYYHARTVPGSVERLIGMPGLYDTGQCVNSAAAGAQAERDCLEAAKFNLVVLQPGQSTTAYCSCVKDGVMAGKSQSEAMVSCSRSK